MTGGAFRLAGKGRPGALIYSTDRAVAWLARTQNVVWVRALGLAKVTGEQREPCNC
jgi:hypothetical protein